MADGNVVENEVVETTETTQAQTPEIPQEVREMMEISLNGGLPPKQEQVQTEVETPTQEAVIDPTPFQFEVFKEKFGYESPDQVLQEIEELRNLKANPPKAEPQYANEESKLIAQALSEGKQEEVYNYLNRKMELEKVLSQEVTEDNADTIIKMSMKAKYSSLNDEQIQHKFNRQYSIPKEPIQGVSEDDDEFQERHNEWKETVGQVKWIKLLMQKWLYQHLKNLKKKSFYQK